MMYEDDNSPEEGGKEQSRTFFWSAILGLLLFGIFIIINASFSVSFILSMILLLSLSIYIIQRKKASATLVSMSFASLSGFSLIALQRYGTVFGIISPPLQKLMIIISFILFGVFLVVAHHFLRKNEAEGLRLLIPYSAAGVTFIVTIIAFSLFGFSYGIFMLLIPALSIFIVLLIQSKKFGYQIFVPHIILILMMFSSLVILKDIFSTTAASIDSILGIGIHNPLNLCHDSPFDLLCSLSSFLGFRTSLTGLSFYKALGSIGLVISGSFVGYAFSQNKSKLKSTESAVVVGLLSLMVFIAFSRLFL